MISEIKQKERNEKTVNFFFTTKTSNGNNFNPSTTSEQYFIQKPLCH